MWRETAPTEAPRTGAPATNLATPVTDEEWRSLLDRMETTRDVFRQNRELRDVLSRRDAETQALRNRNAELEDILRKFAPTLLNIATTMGLAAKNEKSDNAA
jgi:ABC-type transporter Mla subunit MlaD